MMKINFFEEFPKKDVWEKVKLIKFSSVVYIAAKSLKEFEKYAKQIKEINKKIIPAYWPVLKLKEGYWLSPFSDTTALKRTLNELNSYNGNLIVLLDLELPTHHLILFFKNLFKFFRNKRLIHDFIKNKPKNLILTTAEHVFVNRAVDFVFRFLGIQFQNKNISERIFMCYSSMARNDYWEKVVSKNINNQSSVGLGVIATGILGNEPVLSVDGLRKDLELAKKSRTKTATIFRLNGLNKNYMEVINNFKQN